MPLSRPTRALALAASIAALAVPARAAQENFDFSLAGIRIGSMALDFESGDGSYTATSQIKTAGIVGAIADFFFDGTASGAVQGSRFEPARYQATSKSPRALRKTSIDWRGGVPVKVSVEPPRSTAPDPAAQGGTLDPVSAGFRLLGPAAPEAMCNTTVDVFDGSRRSRLKLAAPKREADTLTCEGTFSRVAGEAHSMSSAREFPFRISFTVHDGKAELERIEAPTNFGQAVISRRG